MAYSISKNVTIGELQKQLLPALQEIEPDFANQQLRWLFEHLFGCSYAHIVTQFNLLLTPKQHTLISQWVNDYLQSKPLAYILGETEFMGLEFIVNNHVLIPRNDTEVMVVKALELIKQQFSSTARPYPKNKPFRILELGTGSGIIAISISKALSSQGMNIEITATDNTPEALAVAKKNARKHQANIIFKVGDWFDAVNNNSQFDMIISNPPYISENEPLEKSLDYEPPSALYANDDGLAEIKKIAKQYRQYLYADGLLLIEHGYQQSESVRYLLQQEGIANPITCLDMAGRERFTVVKNTQLS